MLLDKDERIEERIVRLLGQHGPMESLELHALIETEGKDISFQAVYKEISKLKKEGIVFKIGRKIGLSMVWISELIDLTRQMQQNFFDEYSASAIIPGEGETKTWKFRDLLVLDDFWNQLFIALTHHCKSNFFLEWIPHPWYHLVHQEKDLALEKSFELNRTKIYQIIGGETYLDKAIQNTYKYDVFHYSFAKGPFETKRNLYFDVIDDYILTIKLNPKTAAQIDHYFDCVSCQADISIADFLEILGNRLQSTITLEHKPKKASRLRNQFSRYFGIEF